MVVNLKDLGSLVIDERFQNDRLCDPQKEHEEDHIWWIHDLDRRGPILFTFDLKTVFNFWSDYPDRLTPEQIEIFKKECPDLAELRP